MCLIASTGELVGLAVETIIVAMPVNTPATPARTSASAVKAKASERAVTATAMAATLSTSNPTAVQMITTAVRARSISPDHPRHDGPDLPEPLAVYGWHAVLVEHLAVRSAQDGHALLLQPQYVAADSARDR